MYLSKKFTVPQMMSISGHKTEAMFYKYVKLSLDEYADTVADAARDGLFWEVGFSYNIIWFGVLVGAPFLLILGNYVQIWPKLGNGDKKKIASSWFLATCNLLWCPEQDLNLHSFRNTHLKRARLPIPPPGHLVAFHLSELLSKKKQLVSCSFLCPGQDLNLHPVTRTTPSK